MLLIDCGNTAIKCRLMKNNQVQDRQFVLREDLEFSGFAQYLESISTESIYLASVSSERAGQNIRELIQQIQPQVIFTQLFSMAELNGISSGYEDYTQLGVDRWLALVAATGLVEADVMIIDAGSAITIDLLSRRKGHLGGAILPGFKTEITKFKEMFPAVDFNHPDINKTSAPGNSTSLCINLSEESDTVLQIQRILLGWSNLLTQPTDILLSGQDAGLIAEQLLMPYQVVPDLVFIGMLKQIQLLG